MSIKYAVLGLIAENPRHGYAVQAAFFDRLGDFWELNYGQVYQVLTALEHEGWIVGQSERVGKRPTRKVYSISPKGQSALTTWLKRAPSRSKPFRDDFYVRLMFMERYEPADLEAILEAQIRYSREHLAELVDRQASVAGAEAEGTVRGLFAAAAICHAEADLRALEECKDTLEQRGRLSRPRAIQKRSDLSKEASGRRRA